MQAQYGELLVYYAEADTKQVFKDFAEPTLKAIIALNTDLDRIKKLRLAKPHNKTLKKPGESTA